MEGAKNGFIRLVIVELVVRHQALVGRILGKVMGVMGLGFRPDILGLFKFVERFRILKLPFFSQAKIGLFA